MYGGPAKVIFCPPHWLIGGHGPFGRNSTGLVRAPAPMLLWEHLPRAGSNCCMDRSQPVVETSGVGELEIALYI